jgi:hypothetical protein
MSVAEVAERILRRTSNGGYVIEEPAEIFRLDPLTFILLLPFLPLYILANIFFSSAQSRRVRVTRIERLPEGGYEIIEVEG